MQHYIFRETPLINPITVSSARRVVTAPHPNPGNFANRSKDKLCTDGRKGGRKGRKAHTGSFRSMDPEKQVIRSLVQREAVTYTSPLMPQSSMK